MRKKFTRFFTHHAIILFFCVYAVIGFICFNDYGCGPDEGMERQTALVNFRYVLETLNIPITDAAKTWLAYLPALPEYRDQFYGTALHFPLVLIEHAFTYRLEPAIFYGMRHFYTFLNFFIATICFCFLIQKRTKNQAIALAGTALLITTPRFFAESFYNNKDSLFTSWMLISLALAVRWVEKPTLARTILVGFVLALTINTRLNGMILLPLILAVFFMNAHYTRKKKYLRYLIFLPIFCGIFYYLITPILWRTPWKTFFDMVEFNRHHPNHTADGNLFMGKLVNAANTRSYIPLWILLTVPTIPLLFSFAGWLPALWNPIRHPLTWFKRRENLQDMLLFLSGAIPAAMIILMHVTIYNTWRHVYFLYPIILYFSAIGWDALLKVKMRSDFATKTKQLFLWGIIAVVIIQNSDWIGKNHPFEYAYFAPPFRAVAGQFSGDYWGISTKKLLDFIVQNDDRPSIVIDHSETQTGSINRGLLSEKDRARLNLVYDPQHADYILFTRDDKLLSQAQFPQFEPVYSIQVDQDTIAMVLKRISDENK